MSVSIMRPLNIAVIGSGISGMACAWLLNQHHRVTLFEKDDRPGGHSNTSELTFEDETVCVDTGFIVYNPVNYPNLIKLFDQLDVPTADTDMSFAVSSDSTRLEYSGCGLNGFFAQRANLLRPRHWQLLREILRFYREAPELTDEAAIKQETLGEMLTRRGYSEAFINHHLIPMGAAIWSTPADQMLDYPALTFLRFCQNHGLVQLKDRPQWRTVVGGSREYVKRLLAPLEGQLRMNSHIRRIHRTHNGVILEHLHGQKEHFDHVVLACHADQALELLAKPTAQEQRLLSCFPYQRNRAILHSDPRLMPKRRSAWASWNYLSAGRGSGDRLSVTYWMNRLQPINSRRDLFVTLNPIEEPRTERIHRSFLYDHPQFSLESISAQQQLWTLQGQQNTWFCGAWFGYGFHEDGLQSGLAVAEALGGVKRPWQLADPNSRIHVHDRARPSGAQTPEAVA
ncbi:MAG: NAD/FAD-binding protein [Oceanospirillaceae bacterium]|uniref:NAD(P)/FAD-dependent oxidoreductase n=1 Tax=Marinobacterium litorale TaxID=404770 RepID=UPI00041A49B9|nr:FAD-dependent oxidoreductase [Marinobacterium litorale]MBT00698.1 NAD/FAD-binding protein [Oceanospirillaceae bacterium]